MRQCHMLSILLFLFVVTEGLFTDEEPEVRTKWGSIRGKWSNSTRSRRIANFLGIPYAEPPLADLRFKVSGESVHHGFGRPRKTEELVKAKYTRYGNNNKLSNLVTSFMT